MKIRNSIIFFLALAIVGGMSFANATTKKQEKVAYLTFDDGATKRTLRVAKILEENDIQATFFITGKSERKYIKKLYETGNTIGNHSYSHDYSKCYKSRASFKNEVKRFEKKYKRVTGENCMKIFRFPGGSNNTVSRNYCVGIMPKVIKDIKKMGYQYFDWNVSAGDATLTYKAPKTIENTVVRNTKRYNTAIILMHDRVESTVEALPNIIKRLKKAGYEFKMLTPNTYAPHFA